MNRHNIFSKCEPGRLLHVVLTGLPTEEGRQNISQEGDALQVAVINARPLQFFEPHYHIPKECPASHVTQELWLIRENDVSIIYYDINHERIDHRYLSAGDVSITFAGGHSYLAGADGVKAIEVKSGPYHGQAADKVFI